MVESGYSVTTVDGIPTVRMDDVDEVSDEFAAIGVKNIDDEELETEEMKVKVWDIPPGAKMGLHGHSSQEEFYYILRGTFELYVGGPDEFETYEMEPGGMFAVSPEIARSYTNIGDKVGKVLVVAAPNVSERGIPVKDLFD